MQTASTDQTSPLAFPVVLSSIALDAQREVVESDIADGTLALIAGRHVAITISNDDEYAAAATELRKIKALESNIDTKRKSITKPYDDAKKSVMDLVRPYTDGLANAERILKEAVSAYLDKLEKERIQAEAKAEEERRKAAEKAEVKADRLEASGKVEQADALREIAATTVAAPISVVAPPKVAGLSSKKVYSAEVTDSAQLIHAAVANQILAKCAYNPEQIMKYLGELASKGVRPEVAIVDQKFLDKTASLLKEGLDWPGCKLVIGKSIASRK